MPTNGWGNIYCNSFSGDTALASGGGGGFIGLLDDYPGAAAAYSLRLLRSDYSGGLVRVMAWNGLASQGEADIMPYKVGDDYVVDLNSTLENLDAIAIVRGLTTSDTLADLVLTGTSNYDGLVPAWYGQDLSGNNATQASAAAMPQIVSGGSLILENGKPSISFDGVNDYLIFQAIPNLSGLDNASYSLVFTPNNVNQDGGIFQHNVDLVNYVALGLGDLGTSPRVGSRLLLSNSVADSNGYDASVEQQNVFIKVERLTPVIQLTANAVDAVDSYQTRSGGAIFNTIGGANVAANFFSNFKLQEFVNWQVNVFASQSGIEANTNNYYAIYP